MNQSIIKAILLIAGVWLVVSLLGRSRFRRMVPTSVIVPVLFRVFAYIGERSSSYNVSEWASRTWPSMRVNMEPLATGLLIGGRRLYGQAIKLFPFHALIELMHPVLREWEKAKVRMR
ncbi:hypothetical protein [Alkalibacillus haloalkaliphilus]|uniref:hypothetical protein n=1 Tax=Alkalibacillus haloalkaliphilus TaxID=94136 RepID=UPI0029359964|nr:hypothetical protein [Alkalibacillus haloalkaliphilus]MDV2582890.1 hypothetical protein [Alkalibacillus haloalkaliphilus]